MVGGGCSDDIVDEPSKPIELVVADELAIKD